MMILTDDEIMEVAAAAAGRYISLNCRGQMSLEECLDAELDAVKAAYKSRNRIQGGKPMRAEDVRTITQSFLRLRPGLAEMTDRKMLSRKRSDKASAIATASAKAIITKLMEGSGLRFEVNYQRYRAKLTVRLDRSSSAVLHLHYKDLLGKDMSGFVPALKVLNAAVERK